MMVFIGIGLAGGAGAILRYSVWRACSQLGWLGFPYATLLVNTLGSFLIGFLVFILQEKWGVSDETQAIVVTGFLGGFTTFSAFSMETITFIQRGELVKALSYIVVTVALCLLACFLGLVLARNLT